MKKLMLLSLVICLNASAGTIGLNDSSFKRSGAIAKNPPSPQIVNVEKKDGAACTYHCPYPRPHGQNFPGKTKGPHCTVNANVCMNND
jgi:hypothetical protein